MSNKCCDIICHINVKLAWTVIGILITFFWATVYIGWFKNWWALGVNLTSVCFAFESLYLYWNVKKGWIGNWDRSVFLYLFWINLIVAVIAIFGMIACILYAALNHQGVAPADQHGQNMWSTATWFLVMIKWTVQNSIFTGLYRKNMNSEEHDEEDVMKIKF